MPKTQRADHTWAKTAYNKAKKIIYAQQSVCGICGRPVDKKLPFPHPGSATIDHIIAVSKGGDPKLVAISVKEKTVSNRELPLSCRWEDVGAAK